MSAAAARAAANANRIADQAARRAAQEAQHRAIAEGIAAEKRLTECYQRLNASIEVCQSTVQECQEGLIEVVRTIRDSMEVLFLPAAPTAISTVADAAKTTNRFRIRFFQLVGQLSSLATEGVCIALTEPGALMQKVYFTPEAEQEDAADDETVDVSRGQTLRPERGPAVNYAEIMLELSEMMTHLTTISSSFRSCSSAASPNTDAAATSSSSPPQPPTSLRTTFDKAEKYYHQVMQHYNQLVDELSTQEEEMEQEDMTAYDDALTKIETSMEQVSSVLTIMVRIGDKVGVVLYYQQVLVSMMMRIFEDVIPNVLVNVSAGRWLLQGGPLTLKETATSGGHDAAAADDDKTEDDNDGDNCIQNRIVFSTIAKSFEAWSAVVGSCHTVTSELLKSTPTEGFEFSPSAGQEIWGLFQQMAAALEVEASTDGNDDDDDAEGEGADGEEENQQQQEEADGEAATDMTKDDENTDDAGGGDGSAEEAATEENNDDGEDGGSRPPEEPEETPAEEKDGDAVGTGGEDGGAGGEVEESVEQEQEEREEEKGEPLEGTLLPSDTLSRLYLFSSIRGPLPKAVRDTTSQIGVLLNALRELDMWPRTNELINTWAEFARSCAAYATHPTVTDDDEAAEEDEEAAEEDDEAAEEEEQQQDDNEEVSPVEEAEEQPPAEEQQGEGGGETEPKHPPNVGILLRLLLLLQECNRDCVSIQTAAETKGYDAFPEAFVNILLLIAAASVNVSCLLISMMTAEVLETFDPLPEPDAAVDEEEGEEQPVQPRRSFAPSMFSEVMICEEEMEALKDQVTQDILHDVAVTLVNEIDESVEPAGRNQLIDQEEEEREGVREARRVDWVRTLHRLMSYLEHDEEGRGRGQVVLDERHEFAGLQRQLVAISKSTTAPPSSFPPLHVTPPPAAKKNSSASGGNEGSGSSAPPPPPPPPPLGSAPLPPPPGRLTPMEEADPSGTTDYQPLRGGGDNTHPEGHKTCPCCTLS